MTKQLIELCAIWENDDGTESVQTGIYLFDTFTLRDAYKLLKGYESRGERAPDRFEIKMSDFEEEEE